MFSNSLYYRLKPLFPRALQIAIRRQIIRRKREKYAHIWPIDESAAKPPEGWKGWPEWKKFAFVLTHDVETEKGVKNVMPLAELEKKLGFRSCFSFVAEDYRVPPELLQYLRCEGFEVSLHGLSHQGNLFRSRKAFQKNAVRINHFLKEWGSEGFRTPSMYHNLNWMGDLEIGYDSSTFDTDPFEPQPDGLGTIFPLWVPGNNGQKGFVELPYTLPQDHTLFILMREKNIDIWKRKLNWIAEKGGMALLITHPDYMSFNATSRKIDEYPAEYYEEFLKYVKSEYGESYWLVRPQEVAEFTSCQAPYPPNKRQFRTRRMRACMLSYSFYESDNRVIRYAEALAERGERVDVIALRKEGQADFEVMNGVNVYRVQERILDEKGKFSYISRLLRFLYKSSVFVSRQHLREPYELVHVHTVPDFEVFAGFLPKLSGASLILDIHDILPEFYASKFKCGPKSPIFKILTIIEKASAGFSDHIIISNHLWAEKVAVRSAKKDKCTVILNYPDLGIFYPRLKKCKDGKVIFLYPGTLNWHQGLDIAIQAFSSIKDKIPEAEFHIYGRGSETNLLQEMIVSLDLTDRVIQRPSVPISKIADVMANADIGLVPKRNDLFGAEAFSTKILEFMSLGIPVIVARTKIDNYYFDDSVVRFFEPGNIDDLAKSMLELVRNKHLRESLSQKATKFVEDFVWQKKKWEYLDLVDRLTGSVRRK